MARLPGIIALLLVAAPSFAAMQSKDINGLSAANLKCEYLENPVGIDTARPRLSWVVESTERAQKQTAYQIIVASSKEELRRGKGDLWDSGKVSSRQTAQVEYEGAPLKSTQRCWWQVRVWDREGNPSDWSEAAWWEMGLLEPGDWHGQWIARTENTAYEPAPLFRREFSLPDQVKRARIYICGLGYHELYVNGKRVGDHLLDPGYTRYDKRDLYVTHSVTSLLEMGKNTLGVVLGTGWYNCHELAVWHFDKAPWRASPRFLLELRAELEDGSEVTLASDGTWKTSTGPIVWDSIYGGETYDARLEKPGWDRTGYDDSGWDAAKAVEAPKGKLAAQMNPPIRSTEIIRPVHIFETKPGVYVFDMGQNFSGRAQLHVSGPAGTKVTLRYSENKHPDGSIDRSNIDGLMEKTDPPQRFQTDEYILKGQGQESWQSRFTYHGFQYVEVTGFPGKPTLDSLTGVFSHTDMRPVGDFECSNTILNRVFRAGEWSYLSNFQGIPTDCPHREKNGWTGDAQIAAEQGMFNYDSPAIYTKWLNDLNDEQQPEGSLPGIVPTGGWGYEWGNGPAWDSAFILIPWFMYEYFGDRRVLEQHYAGMKRYVDYLVTKAQDGIVSIGLGDWAPAKTETPREVTDTGYFYADARILSRVAGILGKDADARKYADLAEGIKRAFNAQFYHPETGLYANGSQTALSCALYQGLVEPENRQRVLDNLVKNIEEHDGHIDTGILGAKYLPNTLTDNGRADVAYRVAAQTTFPSWGWWIEQGATTLWEQWNGNDSRNHIMYGDILAWMIKTLAGINADPDGPGFAHFTIRPHVVGDLTYARATYRSIRGLISSRWRKEGGTLTMDVQIPANTSATVCVPSSARDKLTVGGEGRGVTFVRMEPGYAVFQVESGSYTFYSKD